MNRPRTVQAPCGPPAGDTPAAPDAPTPASANPAPARKPKRKKPRHSMPEDWAPRPDVRDQMADECPGVDQDAELRSFRDWAMAEGKTSTDWNLNYRRWIRNEAKWNRNRPGGDTRRGMTPAECLAGIPTSTDTPRRVTSTQLPAFPTDMEILR
ncbi:hypothetical protein [Corynebacterium variabile]|uniref:hypothetical protein n=1 Tax=Corynebacterium variabile TaxID=1727 RepID=UPI003FD40346